MILEINKITKEFQFKGKSSSRLKILDELSLQIKKGETAAILGKSGSGKSTFLSLVAGLDQPTSGEIILNGTNIAKMEEKELADFRARKISIVFQQFHLLSHLTALENVSLPLQLLQTDQTSQEIIRDAEEMLEMVGLKSRLHHFPSELSGGEQQRVAIARALVVKPDLLLADEPTGNLDNQTSQEVTKQFFQIVKDHGLSLILVSHDENIAKNCHHRYFLKDGKLKRIK